jgi:hypothetical protein
MKRILTLCGLFATLTVLFFSCQKNLSSKEDLADIRSTLSTQLALEDLCGEPVTKELADMWSGAVWGSVVIGNDKDYIIVQINSTQPGMYLNKATLSFGSEASVQEDLLKEYFWDPCQGPAAFDLQKTWTPNSTTSDTVRIPIAAVLEDGCIWISVNVGLLGEFGTIACAFASPYDNRYASGLWHSAFKYCITECPPDDCQPLRTQTPGGWGAEPNGNNNGTYLHANFAAAFPAGLRVGCSPGNYHIDLTTAQAITNLLPTGGEASVLTANTTNPASIKNVLVGHVVALTLSVGFDAKFEDFGQGGNKLADMIINSGAFKGWTVANFLAEANKALGGCGSYTPKQVMETITAINENYVDGKTDKGYLVCAGGPRLQ